MADKSKKRQSAASARSSEKSDGKAEFEALPPEAARLARSGEVFAEDLSMEDPVAETLGVEPQKAVAPSSSVLAEPEELPSGSDSEPKSAARVRGNRATDFEPRAWASATKEELESIDKPVSYGDGVRLLLSKLRGTTKSLNPLELVALVILGLASLVGLIYFRGLASSKAEPKTDYSLSAIPFPAKGSLLTLGNVHARWREPQAGDVARPDSKLLPSVDIELAGGTGVAKVFFRNQDAKIQGDVLVYKVSNGTMNGGKSFTAVATEGYANPMDLEWVRAGQQKPWHVQIYDCPKEDSSLSESSLIAEFEMPHDQSPKAIIARK